MGAFLNLYAETNTVSSTVVTNSTPPTANAPTIMNNNSDICKVGVGLDTILILLQLSFPLNTKI